MLTREEIEEVNGWAKSPTFDIVFDLIENRFTEEWKKSDTNEDREYCWLMIQCLKEVERHIKSLVDDDKVNQFNASRARVNNWNIRPPTEDSP